MAGVDSARKQEKLEATAFPPPNTTSNPFIPLKFLLSYLGKVPKAEGAGMNSARKQKKTEARKVFENRSESPSSSPRFVGQFLGRKAC
jgi:hypothetical protein